MLIHGAFDPTNRLATQPSLRATMGFGGSWQPWTEYARLIQDRLGVLRIHRGQYYRQPHTPSPQIRAKLKLFRSLFGHYWVGCMAGNMYWALQLVPKREMFRILFSRSFQCRFPFGLSHRYPDKKPIPNPAQRLQWTMQGSIL